jgi:hypothetical protein
VICGLSRHRATERQTERGSPAVHRLIHGGRGRLVGIFSNAVSKSWLVLRQEEQCETRFVFFPPCYRQRIAGWPDADMWNEEINPLAGVHRPTRRNDQREQGSIGHRSDCNSGDVPSETDVVVEPDQLRRHGQSTPETKAGENEEPSDQPLQRQVSPERQRADETEEEMRSAEKFCQKAANRDEIESQAYGKASSRLTGVLSSRAAPQVGPDSP